jgi:hypothetical protein
LTFAREKTTCGSAFPLGRQRERAISGKRPDQQGFIKRQFPRTAKSFVALALKKAFPIQVPISRGVLEVAIRTKNGSACGCPRLKGMYFE